MEQAAQNRATRMLKKRNIGLRGLQQSSEHDQILQRLLTTRFLLHCSELRGDQFCSTTYKVFQKSQKFENELCVLF